jgi:hypothetical protein
MSSVSASHVPSTLKMASEVHGDRGLFKVRNLVAYL